VSIHTKNWDSEQESVQQVTNGPLFYFVTWTNTSNNNRRSLLEASKEAGLEVHPEKSKCMVVSHRQNAGQKHSSLVDNKSFKMWQSASPWEQQ